MCWLAHIYSGDLVGEVQIRNLTDDLIEQRLCPLSRVVLVRRSVLSSSRQQRSVSSLSLKADRCWSLLDLPGKNSGS